MVNKLTFVLVFSFFIGCGGGGDGTVSTANSSLNDSTLSLVNQTGTFSCTGEAAYDTLTLILTSSNVRMSDCIIDSVVWSGENSTVTVEANSTIQSISYSATSSTLEARQGILDLVNDFELTEVLY